MLTALRRRWVLLLILIAIVCVLGLAAIRLVPADYEAEATVALVPPVSEENPNANRYLLLGGLNPARDIVIRSLNSDQSRESIIDDFDGATYSVEPDFTTSAPIIAVTAVGTSEADASQVLREVLAAIPATLATLQDQVGTDTRSRIDAQLVAEDEPHRAGKNQIRAVVAVTGAVGGLGLLLIGAIDGHLLRRKRRATGGNILPTPATEAGPHVNHSRASTRETTSASTRNDALGDALERTRSMNPGKSGSRVGPRDS